MQHHHCAAILHLDIFMKSVVSPARIPRLECYLKDERLVMQNVAFPNEFITNSTTAAATFSVWFMQRRKETLSFSILDVAIDVRNIILIHSCISWNDNKS